MATNKESINGLIEKLALVSDEIGKIFPESRSVVVFSLNQKDFDFSKTQVDNFSNTNQFKIDISGIEFIFLRDELLNIAEDKI
jgi:hypothetical protein